MKAALISCIALGTALVVGAPALAQSKSPYRAGGAGISLGYRQAILNDQLLGSRPKALVRGPSGELLDVERRNSQAFLRSPDSGAFLAGARPNSSWPTGLGNGLGWGNEQFAISSGQYATGARSGSDSLTGWISLLPTSVGQSYWGSLGSFGGFTPIDIWIRQI